MSLECRLLDVTLRQINSKRYLSSVKLIEEIVVDTGIKYYNSVCKRPESRNPFHIDTPPVMIQSV